MLIFIPCKSCGMQWEQPENPKRANVGFYCRICRCADCEIVFGLPCDCGEIHGVRSTTENTICTVCEIIRERVKNMDPELLHIRNSMFLEEKKSDKKLADLL